jgi:SAM-dependent methyltransferase
MNATVRLVARSLLSDEFRTRLTAFRSRHRLQWPRAGTVEFGDFARLKPVSPIFGMERGKPVDRYYIESFLRANAFDITGRCLELGDPYYTERFGQGVTQADVLHYVEGNPIATIVGDLTDAPHIPDGSFDCIIFTQTIQMIFEPDAAFRTLHRILKPGGVALVTTAGIAKIGRRLGRDDWGEYWHFTAQSLDRAVRRHWQPEGITISTYGNVMSACCFLQGLAAEELLPEQLDTRDEDFEVIVAARLEKSG